MLAKSNYIVKKRILLKRHLVWYDIPGYSTFVEVLISEMQSRSLPNFRENIVGASRSAVENTAIIIFFIPILFRKTNLHNNVHVYKTFDILHIWFSVLKRQNAHLPSTFDSAFFFGGILKVFEVEDSVSIEKALWFLYYHFSFFPINLRLEFWLFLQRGPLIRLFLHWSKTLRRTFIRFLFFTVHRLHKDHNCQRNTESLRKEVLNRIDNKSHLEIEMLGVN